jgi:hypothetical protein
VAGAMERGRDLLDQAVAALADPDGPDDPRS